MELYRKLRNEESASETAQLVLYLTSGFSAVNLLLVFLKKIKWIQFLLEMFELDAFLVPSSPTALLAVQWGDAVGKVWMGILISLVIAGVYLLLASCGNGNGCVPYVLASLLLIADIGFRTYLFIVGFGSMQFTLWRIIFLLVEFIVYLFMIAFVIGGISAEIKRKSILKKIDEEIVQGYAKSHSPKEAKALSKAEIIGLRHQYIKKCRELENKARTQTY